MTRLETTLCLMRPRDLVSQPDNKDETVLHTSGSTVLANSAFVVFGALRLYKPVN